ncbi:MAG: tyrosine-type recombinase/integrase [Steroidobacteraceae bacterium]
MLVRPDGGPYPHGPLDTPAPGLCRRARRRELQALRWPAIDPKGKQLTIEGSTAKNQQTRNILLNAEALEVLKQWKEQARDGERVFPISTGFKIAWAALLERAKITKFRWHDLRHHFASRLVQP